MNTKYIYCTGNYWRALYVKKQNCGYYVDIPIKEQFHSVYVLINMEAEV